LDLPEDASFSEKEMETAIISKLQQFLLEMGKGFSFVGRQFRISTETTHFYIDLVFYNYILKCFVVVVDLLHFHWWSMNKTSFQGE
jgi:predicted nuclease of restriction endonuclease-like (RecB) superfamily